MDNRLTIPGYKFYVDARTGERPAVYVTSLNVVPEDGAQLNGLAFGVERGALPLFDLRERQYHRVDVTDTIDADLGTPVFAYLGRREARDRYERGRAEGTSVVSREYVERVRAGFALLGDAWLAELDATTDPPEVPIRDLRRIDVDACGARPAEAPRPGRAPRSTGAA